MSLRDLIEKAPDGRSLEILAEMAAANAKNAEELVEGFPTETNFSSDWEIRDRWIEEAKGYRALEKRANERRGEMAG